MEKIEVTINSKQIFEEVYKKTEYVGYKRTGDDSTLYEQARASKYNEEILSDYFAEACSMSDLNLKEFLAPVVETAPDTYKRLLQPSSRFIEMLTDTVKDALKNFFVSYVTGKWLELCTFDAAQEYLGLAAACIKDVQDKLLAKSRPQPAAKGEHPVKTKGGIPTPATTANTHKQRIKGSL